jgi:hypothetical protein
MEMIEAPLDLSTTALEIQIKIPAELLAPLDPATHKEVLDSAEELFYSDAKFLDLYLKKQLMLQTGYVAKSVRDLKTDFTPSDTIKDTPEMKELALYYQEIGAKYKSNVTRIFVSSVEFQKQTHLKSIPLLVVQSIFRICHSHIRRFTLKNVLQKTGYADFDDSEDNTDASAKLEDEEVRKVRKRHLAGYATLFLITDLYGILREYCYPLSKMRESLPMNTLFRFAMEYVVCHASILVYSMDLNNLDHDLGFLGSATRNPNDREVLDLTANPPQRSEGEQQSNVPPPAAKAPSGPSLEKDR